METSASRLGLLTPAGWPGLPITGFACGGRVRYTDLQMPESTLFLHQSGGADLHVRRGALHWKFTTTAGSFDFYPAGVYDELNSLGAGTRGLAITLSAAFEHLVSHEVNRAALLTPRFQFQDRRLERLVQALLERSRKQAPGPDEVTVSLATADRLQELLATARTEDRAPVFSPILHRLVKEHLDRNLHAPVEVEAVAALTGLARTQFSVAFRQSFGLSLHQYVVDLRIGRAKQHLLSKEASLTELAYQLGFASHSHFSTVFKSRVGVTPSQFRQHQLAGSTS